MRGNSQADRRTYRALSRNATVPKLIAAWVVLVACAFASVLAVVANAAPTSHTRSYSITDLGTLGGPASSATAINNRGQVVGFSDLSGGSLSHAFLYSRGMMIDLLPGSENSNASDINNRGDVVGTEDAQAFLYRRGQVTHIGLGGTTSAASAVNDRGEVAGASAVAGTDFDFHAFVYRHGQTIDLTPSLPTGPLGEVSGAQDVNDRGQVVGFVSPQLEFFPQPFLWRRGALNDLPLVLPGDAIAVPSRINNSGEVVGVSVSFVSFEEHAVLLSHGRLISLGPGQASSINNRGQVVGFSFVSGNEGAFLYEKGTRTELNSVLPPNSGWALAVASDINDRGQIVGGGIHNGAFHAFVLSPSGRR
jgi:probable HAF family extracellular repeat protein